MNDTYQAVFDVARNRIGYFSGSELIDAISRNCDASFAIEQIKNEFIYTAAEMARPSVIYRPSIQIDGDQWCVLYGTNLQCGVAGFGDSPAKAMADFDKAWLSSLPKKVKVDGQ